MKEIHIRGIIGSDLISVCTVANAALPADVVTPKLFARKVFLDMNFDPSGVLVAETDEKIVGFIVAYIRNHPLEDMPDDSNKCWITLFGVLQEYSGQGIGTALLNKIEEWFRANGKKIILVGPYAPNWWCPGVDVNVYPHTIKWLEKRGYMEAVCPLSMDLDMAKYRRPEWVNKKEHNITQSGVHFCDFRPELIPDLFCFLKQEFPGDWQRHIRETVNRILDHESSSNQIQIAIDNEKVIGFAHYSGERFGPFGTAVSQRGRGVGAVLLCRTLETMRNNGFHNAFFLWTDNKTAKLYTKAGFCESRRYSLMKKSLG